MMYLKKKKPSPHNTCTMEILRTCINTVMFNNVKFSEMFLTKKKKRDGKSFTTKIRLMGWHMQHHIEFFI